MPNSAAIIIGHVVIQRNNEHMQKQEDQLNINNLHCCQCANVANLVILSLDLVTSSPLMRLFSKA